MKDMPPIEAAMDAHRLDLSRPELRPIMKWYAPRSAVVVTLSSRPAALIAALGEDGWSVSTCAGPGRVRCPLLESSGVCAARRCADVAVVFADPRALWPRGSLLPRLRCAADPASPAVVALEGRLDPVTPGRGRAIVGALRGPSTIVRAARALTDEPALSR